MVPPFGCGSWAKTEQEDRQSTALSVADARDTRNIMTSILELICARSLMNHHQKV
jgi:hypothetical protein